MPHNYILRTDSQFDKQILKLTKDLEKPNRDSFFIWLLWDGCGHCVAMEKAWGDMKKEMGKSLRFIEIEHTQYDHLKKHHPKHPLVKLIGEVHGYPHLVGVRKSPIDYYEADNKEGTTRTKKQLMAFAKTLV